MDHPPAAAVRQPTIVAMVGTMVVVFWILGGLAAWGTRQAIALRGTADIVDCAGTG